MTTKNEALAKWAESDAPTINPAAVIHRGTPDSRAAARDLLLAAADSPAETAQITNLGGRPSLAADGPVGASPLWQVRAPRDLDKALRDRAAAEGRTLSEVVRAAALQYLGTNAESHHTAAPTH